MATALDKYADMKPTWDGPVVIESHINGIRSKEMNPNTPVGYEEIAEDAIRCWEAGAGAIHAHNTSFDLPSDGSIDFERVAISCSFAANQAAYALALRPREKVTLTGVVDSYDQIGRVLWLKDCRGN